ncbi:hypothetical protein T12_10583 [Trichinella patagoniensis]|uniref:Uncharacterized protein n=1 Tax=Trichinella patagoniensis TaxID=990121 RepID=A0A0V0Z4S0_9BILA|nr:hypothetical protein T12_7241 [Trichinella patagoniensis]KRY05107.1 hypothetical protein T12_15444 [Trichinella patagoniensis]KRY05422.1 hypothetical protein T12_12371 [Trichinella patagoniensis]KRY07299.1 hypothetical protein T12_5595 [Trichinella patagoniensis]KRY12790.1 hypothetical protein T12_10583 [Trichinella patagoniensis]
MSLVPPIVNAFHSCHLPVRFQYKTFPTLQWLTSTPLTVFKLPVDAANVLD